MNSNPVTFPNDRSYYTNSPVAKYVLKEESLDQERRHLFSRTINRKLKMQDTFTRVFPSYLHAQQSIFKIYRPLSQVLHIYPERGEDGKATHAIDR